MTIHKENQKQYFYRGYSQTAGRQGDLYVLRQEKRWHINAGVCASGHNPGFGAWCDVLDDSGEMADFALFLQKVTDIQKFMTTEFHADAETCLRVFLEIWQYIHQTGR